MKQMDVQNPKVRAAVGKRASWIGILSNVLLAAGKLVAGGMAASMSIVADGVNNLSDAAGSIVTLIGFQLAEKPADREHPYGHARFEYLASLTVAVLILVAGLELATSAFQKMLHPVPTAFSALTVGILIAAVLVKAWLTVWNRKMGQKIQSATLIAAAADSRNDALATGAVLLAALAEQYAGWNIDGVMGLLVACFIVYSGIRLVRETVSPLLGEGANADLQKQFTAYINAYPMILGCHNLMLHDYGPGKRYASIHVEIDQNQTALASHAIIDQIERDCLKQFGIHVVIHCDPVLTGRTTPTEPKTPGTDAPPSAGE